MDIVNNLYKKKATVLDHFRHRANESLNEIKTIYGSSQYQKRADSLNKAIQETRDSLITVLNRTGQENKWHINDIINNVLMFHYCCNVIMIEYRNMVWPYEYMAFSRRIGELWEPFCKLCFHYPVRRDMKLYIPPLFSDVKDILDSEIKQYIRSLKISDKEINQLIKYYDKVWTLVNSGEIKLELDLHFKIDGKFFDVDFKSGFSSNEKGNTNRLLLVASIYKNIIKEKHNCMIFVRADEAENNHYLQTLKNSDIWEVYCGNETYEQIHNYSGFNLKEWISTYIDWENDFSQDTMKHIETHNLQRYLKW